MSDWGLAEYRQRLTPVDLPSVWVPHAGAQARFAQSNAYEILYGGAAGGGKSQALLFSALEQVHHPAYKALILRRTYPELRELMDRALGSFSQLGGTWNEQQKRWSFTSGATIEFGYCATYPDVLRYQGQQYVYVGFDEIGQVADERIWTYLMSRNRTPAQGLKLRMRASANPGGAGHAWLKRRFIDACGPRGDTIYSDPKTGLTRSFIPARLKDNPSLPPEYELRLMMLPELERRQLLEGDWDAGDGLALPELQADKHLVRRSDVTIQRHWTLFGSFDWGYNHPFSFGLYTVPGDGNILKLDTITGRRMQDHQILAYLREALKARSYDFSDLDYVVSGSDCWGVYNARGGSGPTTAERFAEGGLFMRQASDKAGSRVQNLATARHYTAWRGLREFPAFRMVDTEGNRKCFEQLHGLVCDPDKPEEVLKVDANSEGEGGDDMADETFYALASRPYVTEEPKREGWPDIQSIAWADQRGEEPETPVPKDGDYDVVDFG